jgi:hypothetical protein
MELFETSKAITTRSQIAYGMGARVEPADRAANISGLQPRFHRIASIKPLKSQFYFKFIIEWPRGALRQSELPD